ncbi:MAG: hypothetical protein QXK88_11230 [Desulfurococcaceae archaeon]
MRKGSRVKFVETEEGVLLVPIISLRNLFGVDRDKRELVHQMLKELQEERVREASEEG